MVIQRLGIFLTLAVLAFGVLGETAMAGQIVYNSLYDCGPNRNKMKVINCGGATCTVFYVNAAMQGGGYQMQVARTTVEQFGSYGCFVKGQGTPGQPAIANAANGAAAPAKPVAVPPAQPGAAAPPAAPAGNGSVVPGKYECFSYSGGHLYSAMSENFTIAGAGSYTDWAGNRGTFTLAGNTVTFQGGALSGHRAKYTPGVPGSNNPPHIALLMADGNPGDTCDGKG